MTREILRWETSDGISKLKSGVEIFKKFKKFEEVQFWNFNRPMFGMINPYGRTVRTLNWKFFSCCSSKTNMERIPSINRQLEIFNKIRITKKSLPLHFVES